MADVAVARILSARTHYDVLELGDVMAPLSVVRRQYKVLAIQVHPDKNRTDGAVDAFKRLSEAYECLVDERRQRDYLTLLTRPAKSRPRPPSSAPPTSRQHAGPPTFPKKYRKKKRPPPPPTQPPVTGSPKGWRTPEDVWAQFQREEEAQAKREFKERGFDRDYDPPMPAYSKRPAASSPPSDSPSMDAESIGSQGIEERARDWTAWKRVRTSVELESPPPVPTPTATATACCLLCRRKFPTNAALTRHEQLSALHKANLTRHGVE